MGIYRVAIQGRSKPILLKADSLNEARGAVVTAEHMNAEEMAEALADGETLWKPGTPLPFDDGIIGAMTFMVAENIKAGELVELREDGKVYQAETSSEIN